MIALRAIVFVVLLGTAPVAAPAPAAPQPAEVVERFHAALLDSMRQGEKLGCEARMARLGPAVDGTFDVPDLAQRVLRRRWPELNDAQRREFTAALHDLIVTTYAREFRRFNGEGFATLTSAAQGANLQQVRTRLTPGSGEPVTLDYTLRSTPQGWRVINVVAGGVSDLALRSAQYEASFKTGGYAAVIDGLRAQTRKIRDQC